MEKRPGNAVAIGNFDGFHLGHQKIIKSTLDIASEYSLGNLLVTFDPNPRKFFKVENKFIFSDSKKLKTLNSSGISRIEYVDFTKVFDMNGSDFINKLLLTDYSMKYLVVGENFKLGKGREWDVFKLAEFGRENDFKIKVVPSELYMNNKISSSMIRTLLRKGDLVKANNMLGNTYSLEGIVKKGNRIGRKLGFPTINTINKNCLLPDGVYMTTTLLNNKTYNGATYIGKKPGLNTKERKIETHIFNFNENVYNCSVETNFLKFKREGKVFNIEADLIAQIKEDIESIKFDFKNEVC